MPGGCLECRMTGFYGRIGLYEIMLMTPALRRLIVTDTDDARLREQAFKDGMKPLRVSGRDEDRRRPDDRRRSGEGRAARVNTRCRRADTLQTDGCVLHDGDAAMSSTDTTDAVVRAPVVSRMPRGILRSRRSVSQAWRRASRTARRPAREGPGVFVQPMCQGPPGTVPPTTTRAARMPGLRWDPRR